VIASLDRRLVIELLVELTWLKPPEGFARDAALRHGLTQVLRTAFAKGSAPNRSKSHCLLALCASAGFDAAGSAAKREAAVPKWSKHS